MAATPVLIFGKDSCPYTQAARDDYARRHLEVQYFNVKKNAAELKRMLEYQRAAGWYRSSSTLARSPSASAEREAFEKPSRSEGLHILDGRSGRRKPQASADLIRHGHGP